MVHNKTTQEMREHSIDFFAEFKQKQHLGKKTIKMSGRSD